MCINQTRDIYPVQYLPYIHPIHVIRKPYQFSNPPTTGVLRLQAHFLAPGIHISFD